MHTTSLSKTKQSSLKGTDVPQCGENIHVAHLVTTNANLCGKARRQHPHTTAKHDVVRGSYRLEIGTLEYCWPCACDPRSAKRACGTHLCVVLANAVEARPANEMTTGLNGGVLVGAPAHFACWKLSVSINGAVNLLGAVCAVRAAGAAATHLAGTATTKVDQEAGGGLHITLCHRKHLTRMRE